MEKCPCGSSLAYDNCCGPLHKGKAEAPTAEALMRSRYSAYVKQEIEYIEKTHKREDGDTLSIEETRKWAAESTWLGLEIVSTEKGGPQDSTGKVEFIARYIQHGLKEEFREIAEFKKENGSWLYEKGTVVPTTVVRAQPKIGRNDPCHCGSGKKFKHCHGA